MDALSERANIRTLLPVLHEIGHDGFAKNTMLFRYGRVLVIAEAMVLMVLTGVPVFYYAVPIPAIIILGFAIALSSRTLAETSADIFALSSLARHFKADDVLEELDAIFRMIANAQTSRQASNNPEVPVILGARLSGLGRIRRHYDSTGRLPFLYANLPMPDFAMYIQVVIVAGLVYLNPVPSWSIAWCAGGILTISGVVNLILIDRHDSIFTDLFDSIEEMPIHGGRREGQGQESKRGFSD